MIYKSMVRGENMTDREKYLTILDRFYRGRGGSLLTKDEREAMEYAISSIKTDLKYDLLYEETTHIADADKMIEPTPKNDLVAIHTEGLDEEIRCTMCTNSMKSDRGCDGSCVVNDTMYKKVMDAIEKRIQPTTKNDCAEQNGCITCSLDDGDDCCRKLFEESMQEPFINKPCVSSGVCEHDKNKVLDKIRAEVENINVWGMRYNPDTDKDIKPQIVQKVKEHIIEIIDRYIEADSAKGTKKETDGYSIPSNWDDLSPQERNAYLGIFS